MRTKEEIEQGYYTDESEDGMCMKCKEHAAPDKFLDDEGEETGEEVSNCCGSNIWIP